jgi:hypothetical protein
MPREYFGCWNRTFDDLRNTETGSEQTRGSKKVGAVIGRQHCGIWHLGHVDGDALRLIAREQVHDRARPLTALSVACQQQAKSFELRAAMSLARLWRDQGKVSEARELFAPGVVYGRVRHARSEGDAVAQRASWALSLIAHLRDRDEKR